MNGVNFLLLSESEYKQLLQDNLRPFSQRLRFDKHDSDKLVRYALPLMEALGCASVKFDEDWAKLEAGEKAGEKAGETEDDDYPDDAGVTNPQDGDRVTNLARPPKHPPPNLAEVPVSRKFPRGSVAVENAKARSSAAMTCQSRPASSKPQAKSKATQLPQPEPSSKKVPAELPTPAEVPPPPPPPPHPVERPRRATHTAAPRREEASVSESGRRGVKRARRLEDLLAGTCPLCKVPRSVCCQPGDWACRQCGQHNYPRRTFCTNKKCGVAKDFVVATAPVPKTLPKAAGDPSSGWCTSCRKPRTECWKANDWECPYCGNHNYARRQVVAAAFQCRVGVGLLVRFVLTCCLLALGVSGWRFGFTFEVQTNLT